MLVAPGGVGKTSLLHGLMNQPLPNEANSTQIADIHDLRPTDNFWAKSKCGNYWSKVTDQDEINELIRLAYIVHKQKKHLVGAVPGVLSVRDEPFTDNDVKKVVDEVWNSSSFNFVAGKYRL